MAGEYRRYYIPAGGAGTLLTLFLALHLWGIQIIDVSGDIVCGEECVSYFDVINPTYRSIYIYNKESVSLDFSPEIDDYELYVNYYGKWRRMDFTMETRLPNIPKDRKYVFVFPRYSVKQFKLVGRKDQWKDIKWGFGFEDEYLDPLWISGNLVGGQLVKDVCNPIYETRTNFYYKNCTAICSKENASYCTPHIYKCVDYKKDVVFQSGCESIGVVNVSGRLIGYEGFFCGLQGDHVICISEKEGGKWNVLRKDGSVDGMNITIFGDEIIAYNSLKSELVVWQKS